jgi:hypothetical protein
MAMPASTSRGNQRSHSTPDTCFFDCTDGGVCRASASGRLPCANMAHVLRDLWHAERASVRQPS